MARCSHAWQFEIMAGMKLALSLTSGIIGLQTRDDSEDERWWGLLYLPGVVAGTVGAVSLAASNFIGPMGAITVVFGGVALMSSMAAVPILVGYYRDGDRQATRAEAFTILVPGLFLVFLLIVLILGALYSDWVLAVIANNPVGYPTKGSKGIQA
ncbi:hypothetical protein LHYA1_G008327, partial [Lachnellula hyalina]